MTALRRKPASSYKGLLVESSPVQSEELKIEKPSCLRVPVSQATDRNDLLHLRFRVAGYNRKEATH